MSAYQAPISSHPSVNSEALINMLVSDVKYLETTGKKPTPTMIWGQPGVGKSDIVKAVGAACSRPVIDIRLLLKDPTEIGGIPYYDPATGKMQYADPAEFPEPNGPLANAIILLDELSSAPQLVQAAALQLVLDRKINSYVLPEQVIIVAAGNRAADGNAHSQMPTPLRNRFKHFDMIVDARAWENWAKRESIHPAVISFISSYPDKLNAFDPKNKTLYAFATPRSWHFVSNELYKAEFLRNSGYNVTDLEMFRSVAASIGEEMVHAFKAHYNEVGKLPNPRDIVYGKIKVATIEKTHMRYACALGVIFSLREILKQERAEWDAKGKIKEFEEIEYAKLITNATEFLIENIEDKDIVITFIHMLLGPENRENRIDLMKCNDLLDRIVSDPRYSDFISMV